MIWLFVLFSKSTNLSKLILGDKSGKVIFLLLSFKHSVISFNPIAPVLFLSIFLNKFHISTFLIASLHFSKSSKNFKKSTFCLLHCFAFNTSSNETFKQTLLQCVRIPLMNVSNVTKWFDKWSEISSLLCFCVKCAFVLFASLNSRYFTHKSQISFLRSFFPKESIISLTMLGFGKNTSLTVSSWTNVFLNHGWNLASNAVGLTFGSLDRRLLIKSLAFSDIFAQISV